MSPHGVRALSRVHAEKPFSCRIGGDEHRVTYDPGESTSSLFGGNSNWRGPVWFPVNYLLVEALEQCHHFYGDDFRVKCPTGSGCRPQEARAVEARHFDRDLSAWVFPRSESKGKKRQRVVPLNNTALALTTRLALKFGAGRSGSCASALISASQQRISPSRLEPRSEAAGAFLLVFRLVR